MGCTIVAGITASASSGSAAPARRAPPGSRGASASIRAASISSTPAPRAITSLTHGSIPAYGTSTLGSAERPSPIADAVTEIRTWRTHSIGTPAIGKIAITASTLNATATVRLRRRTIGPIPTSATASASSPISLQVGAPRSSVAHRSIP